MKHLRLLLLIALACGLSGQACAESPRPPRLPGVELAEGITQLTGVAISPLLGVSTVGAWRYFHAPAATRPELPWFCQPYVWGVGLCVLSLCFLKDTLGNLTPALLKKPLDVLELFENKLSGLIACSAFLPFIVTQMLPHFSGSPEASLSTAVLPLASAQLGAWVPDLRLLTIPLAMLGFLTVWLAGHAINVLIALCPFTFVDSLLKLGKAALLSAVVASSFFSPFLGAAVSLVIIFVAFLVAPWAFRITVFGTLFGLDVLLPRRGRRLVRATEPHAFLARSLSGVPVRTYGRLARGPGGGFTFRYRPWLIFPERALTLGPGTMAMAKGILFPSLLHAREEGGKRALLVIFLPRYRTHEETIASHFEISEIVDSPLMKGFRAIRTWITETLSFGRSPAR